VYQQAPPQNNSGPGGCLTCLVGCLACEMCCCATEECCEMCC
jgi:hypothetical protein